MYGVLIQPPTVCIYLCLSVWGINSASYCVYIFVSECMGVLIQPPTVCIYLCLRVRVYYFSLLLCVYICVSEYGGINSASYCVIIFVSECMGELIQPPTV